MGKKYLHILGFAFLFGLGGVCGYWTGANFGTADTGADHQRLEAVNRELTNELRRHEIANREAAERLAAVQNSLGELTGLFPELDGIIARIVQLLDELIQVLGLREAVGRVLENSGNRWG